MVALSIILAILVFGLIIVVHEVGHFIAARLNKITVLEFAIGMGPAFFKRKTKTGMQFSLRLFPIGGYCKMLGEDESNDDPGSYNKKKVWQRFIVSVSGAFMNFALAFVISVIIVSFTGFTEAVVYDVAPDSPAEAAGLQYGDRIVRANNYGVTSFNDLAFAVNLDGEKPITFKIKRDGQTLTKTAAPIYNEDEDRYMLGVISHKTLGVFQKGEDGLERAGLFKTVGAGYYSMTNYIKTTVVYLSRFVTFKIGLDKLSGPVGVAGFVSDYVSEVATDGGGAVKTTFRQKVIEIISFVAVLCAAMSANIGVFNLLPLPALDGGRCIFLIIEGIRRKPINPDREGLVHFIGLVLLMALAVFVAFSDVLKLF